MKLTPLHASLLTLALFAAGPGFAASGEPQHLRLAQAETDAASPEFDPIRKFLAATKDVSQMEEDRLQQRLNRARKLRETEGLPAELDEQLQQTIAALEAEITRRQETAQATPEAQPEQQAQQPATEQPTAPEAVAEAPQEQPAVEQRAVPDVTAEAPQEQAQAQEQPAVPAQAAGGSEEIAAFLQGVRPASELGEAELREQMRRAAELSQTAGISRDQRRALRNVIREGRAALSAGGGNENEQAQQSAAAPEQQAQPAAPEPSAPQEQAGASAEANPVAAFLQTVRPASELNEDQLRQQMRRASELSRTGGIAPDERRALRNVIREARAALRGESPAAQQQAQQPQPEAQQPQVGQSGSAPDVDPALEQQARALLNDNADVNAMERAELRDRLTSIRDLLATDKLAPETAEALRAKLAQERQVLRAKVAESEQGASNTEVNSNSTNVTANTNDTTTNTTVNNTTTNNTTSNTSGNNSNNNNTTSTSIDNSVSNTNTVVNNNNTTVTQTEVRVVMRDQRPPDELDDEELVRRIDVYRQIAIDDDYSEEDRRDWEHRMDRDRRYLRQRMLEERRQREVRLRSGQIEFNIDIEDDYEPGRRVPRSVFAAEADDEEITDVLTAPPRRKVQRRYSVEDMESSPEARDAVARIEIDTVHFGFGEGFLREEEIDKLDRIAQVLERILAKNPDEVFLLEGHTDAVGSDAANLQLSRQRAKAVREALTTYYVIPAENLKTAGLGERYLKIPIEQPEAENRRVSLARITALVGRND